MRVCVFTDEISKDFDQALDLAKAAGADCVEIRGGLYGGDVTSVDAPRLDRIKAALDRTGLRVASIGSPFGKCRFDSQDEIDQHYRILERAFALGRALNCHLIRCFGFWNPAGKDIANRVPLTAYLDRVASLMLPAVQAAQAGGFIIGLENEEDTMVATAAEVVLLHQALGSPPSFGLVWDILNELHAGELPYPNGYNVIRDYIVHVHIKPNAAGNMLTVGETGLSYAEILVALHAIGFRGAVSIEHWGLGEPQISGVRQLRTAVNTLTS